MISAEELLTATTESLVEVADTYFEMDGMPEVRLANDSPKCGALIGLVSDHNVVQLMLISTRQGTEVLAKALLGFGQDESIEIGDLADAIGEIVNIVAGMVKTVVADQDAELTLTLPTFMEGTFEPLGNQSVVHTELQMGNVTTKVIVTNKPRNKLRTLNQLKQVSAASMVATVAY